MLVEIGFIKQKLLKFSAIVILFTFTTIGQTDLTSNFRGHVLKAYTEATQVSDTRGRHISSYSQQQQSTRSLRYNFNSNL